MTYPIKTLGQLCSVRIGRTPRRDSPQYWGGSAPWITVGELNGEVITVSKEQISDLAVREVMPAPVPPGTLLYSFKLSIGKMGIAGVPLYTNEAIASLEIRNPEELDRDYLRYALLTGNSESGANHAVLGKVLNKAKVEALPVLVPPLPEQRRIVDLLARAEGIVRLRREAEQKAAELIPALFLDMFGDPATNPKGWPEHSLGDIAQVVSGVTKGRKFGDKQTVEVPYLRVANVQAGHIDLTEVKTIEVLPRDVEQLALQNGDVVLTEGGDFDKLGRGALWEHDIANCVHQNHVFRVRCNRSVMLPQFFVIYLQSSRAREYFLRCAKRTTNLASINMTQLRALPVVLPAMDTQREFVERFTAGRSIESQQSAATTKAQETFAALLASVFSAA